MDYVTFQWERIFYEPNNVLLGKLFFEWKFLIETLHYLMQRNIGCLKNSQFFFLHFY